MVCNNVIEKHTFLPSFHSRTNSIITTYSYIATLRFLFSAELVQAVKRAAAAAAVAEVAIAAIATVEVTAVVAEAE